MFVSDIDISVIWEIEILFWTIHLKCMPRMIWYYGGDKG